ncbi:neuraminidase-like domain-containing protein [Paenibacillus sp. NPDC056579]|uniref:neuraminidase-like domain-containing protein n=1 Tax=Paenibacillus sp. NPDC056579 TaxID=3345871 RepID=UPI0036A088F1
MNLIVPVEPGKQGPEVADLQDALLLFFERRIIFGETEEEQRAVIEVLQRERKEQTFESMTKYGVTLFQKKRDLNVQSIGTVDEVTSNDMNSVLRQLGMLGEEGWTRVVEALNEQGQMLKAINIGTDHLASIEEKLRKSPLLSFNMRGETVKALHVQLAQAGVELPSNETESGLFGVGTRDAITQLQAKYNLVRTGIYDDATRNALAIAVSSSANPRRVEGRILLENGLPAAKIKLRIVNKGFGDHEDVLGEIETDDRGFYALPYEIEEGAANLEIRSLDEQNREVRLSNPKMNAERGEVINLVAPSTIKSQANEFALLTADLSKVKGVNIATLAAAQENEDQQDIGMLHQSTEWDARLIVSAAITAQLHNVTGIGHDALYGAVRAGLPHDPEALSLVPPEAFALALRSANEGGIISLTDGQTTEAISAFESFALDKRRTAVVPGTLSNVNEMLDKVQIDPGHKDEFMKLLWKHEGDDLTLWTEAGKKGIPVADLKLQGKLAYLTLNNAPLTEALQREFDSIDKLPRMVEQDLYTAQGWIARLEGMSLNEEQHVDSAKLASLIPSAFKQDNVNDRASAYADNMASKVRESFPIHVICRMLEKEELLLGQKHTEVKEPVLILLKNAANMGFRLGSTPVVQFLKKNRNTVYEGLEEDKQHIAELGLKLLARVYQMSPNDEAMVILFKLNFTSARQVASIPRAQFIEKYSPSFGSRIATETIWDKSAQITSTTFNFYSMGKMIDSIAPMPAISGTLAQHEEAKNRVKSLLKDYPTMESLFDSLDYCECDHCRSVLSPAAYVVDLFRFIDPPEEEWNHTLNTWKDNHNGQSYTNDYGYLKPYDALTLRRPDLPHLKLTCENTNTALPYIDLVNEILEYYVAYGRLDENAMRDTGDAESSDLLAEPNNMNTAAYRAAYNTLRTVQYPLTMPFDLWLETVRKFSDYFKTPFWEMLDTFRPSDQLFDPTVDSHPYGRAAVLMEYLKLTSAEVDLYTKPDTDAWPAMYGYDEPTDTEDAVLAELRSAKTAACRLGLTYKELTELMMTAFNNPHLNRLAKLRALDIELSHIYSYMKHPDYPPLAAEEVSELEKRLTQFHSNFEAKQWLIEAWNRHEFDHILILNDSKTGGSFDQTTIGYAGRPTEEVSAMDYIKMNLFVRLWKKLGWTMEETDLALCAFCQWPEDGIIDDQILGSVMKTALVYIAHLQQLAELLRVGKNGRAKLLTLWSAMPTNGTRSLYSQLFLTRTVLKEDAVYDDPLGNYLSSNDVLIANHLPTLLSALNLTTDEVALILQDGGKEEERDLQQAKLTLTNISLLYRYGLLAQSLGISIAELIALKAMSGLNPFELLKPVLLGDSDNEYPLALTLEFVKGVQQLQSSQLTIADADYLIRHHYDPLGPYKENGSEDLNWIRSLASELRTIAFQFAVPDQAGSVNDNDLRQKLALVFVPDAVEKFMAFWQEQPGFELTGAAFESFFRTNFDVLFTFEDYFGEGVEASRDEKRMKLLQRIMPFMQAKLVRQAVLRAMTAQSGGDPQLVEELLTNSGFLALPDSTTEPLLAAFERLAVPGMSVEFSPPSALPLVTRTVEVTESDRLQHGKWTGLLEVPLNGMYRFYAVLGKQGAEAVLRFHHLSDPILKFTAAANGDVQYADIELKAGNSYAFTCDASLQKGAFQLLVKGETTAKDAISQYIVIPQSAAEAAQQACTMLRKGLQLAQGIGLSAREIRYIAANREGFGGADWRKLPARESNDSELAASLYRGINRLMDYARLKREMSGGSDDLIALFEHVKNEQIPALMERIAAMTRRKKETVESVSAELNMSESAHFADVERVGRLWKALQLVEKFGVPLHTMKKWLTPKPDYEAAIHVRSVIKSRFSPEVWQQVAKPIFDPLRQRQRDALVAHTMHLLKLDSTEKLFEYFLIDPGTEPVVQTSRLRLAISSLQTFIQRCFLNLEPWVHPIVLNKEHWSWTKSYRVWEANRKIFLFPENWLEPEWRDDKTYLYKELESSLLQGDVTNQLAEDALYTYLDKLGKLARLEIVTMYAQERAGGTPVMHVIGRTYSSPHEYFYRQYSNQMWTPWEPVNADIDSSCEHFAVVMWRGRLHLFWIKITVSAEEKEQAVDAAKKDISLADAKLAELDGMSPKSSTRVLNLELSWSEYFQGTWSARQSSGFIKDMENLKLTSRFDPSAVFTTITKEPSPDPEADGNIVIRLHNLMPAKTFAFRVVSKNSIPQFGPYAADSPAVPYATGGTSYNRFKGSGALTVTFIQQVETIDGKNQSSRATQTILSNGGSSFTLLPTSNAMKHPNEEFAPLISPFVFADDLYTFFVEPTLTETTIDKWEGYTIPRSTQKPKWDDMLLHLPRAVSPVIPPKLYNHEVFRLKDSSIRIDPVDQSARYAVMPNTDVLTQSGTAVQYGGNLIGAAGRIRDVREVTHVITQIGGINLNFSRGGGV